jgi:hypothetical protein
MTGLSPPGRRAAIATGRVSVPRVVRAWASAGCTTGWCLGAALGAFITLIAGIPSLAIIGVILGGTVGALSGLAVGSLDGLMLGCLAGTPVLRPAARNLACRTTMTAVLTTVLSELALQLALFGRSPDAWVRVLYVYLPVVAGALAAAIFSRRLPPGRW